MPRHPRHHARRGPPSARPARVSSTDLRALVEEGIIAAAAMNARDDLELAAASLQRLGALTSGMWRALSRELATAAERLDRSTMERFDDIQRRADVLHVQADDVIRAGVAAAHLVEHRATLEPLAPTDDPDRDAHHLLKPDMLFGFIVEPIAPFALDAKAESTPAQARVEPAGLEPVDDEPPPGSVRVELFLWLAPLTPVVVSIAPSLMGSSDDADKGADIALDMRLAAPPTLLEALAAASGLSAERVDRALTSLAVACWTSHQLDDLPPDEEEEEEEEETDDDVEHDE